MREKTLKLMIPGPIQPDQAVLQAMSRPVPPHYGTEFTNYYNDTLELLRKVFNTQGTIFLMVGTGSVALDSCIGSAFSNGEKVLVGTNGFFGERLKAIAVSNGLDVVSVSAEWGEPLCAADFDRAFSKNPDATGALVVHLETSTAIANPVQEIGPIVRQHGGVFVVDAVSSLGGLPFQMDDWCIDLCASASQKCLGAPPGLAPLAVGERGWEYIDRNPQKNHGWYTDLRIWRQYATEWADWHPFPVTMATNNVMALHTSLEQLLEEGIPQRLEHYRQLALRLRSGLRRIGMLPFTPDNLMVPVLTAAYGPPGVPTSKIVDYMAEQRGIKISGGLGSLKDKIFRVGHMSPVLQIEDIDQVIEALEAFRSHAGN